MKKRLFFINESGFILPYVLFLITIIFIVLTANIHIYKQETYNTHHHLEQLKIETLVQMGIMTFKNDYMDKNIQTNEVTYTFPDGTVDISFVPKELNEHLLHIRAQTNDNSYYTTRNIINIDSESI